MNPLPEVRLPRWGSLARLLLPLDLLFVAWACALHAWPARTPALVLIALAFLVLIAMLIQTFAWVTVIAFFARERAREGLCAAGLLALQLVTLLAVLWLAN